MFYKKYGELLMAKYNKQIKIEKKGVAILQETLQSDFIDTFFNTNDKTPLIDGFLLFVNDDSNYSLKFSVQIKSSNHFKRDKNNNVVFQCPIDILESIKDKIIVEPVILFLVEIEEKNIFFKYLSEDFLSKLNWKNKTNISITFSNKDLIADIKAFENELKFYTKKIKSEQNYFSAKELEEIIPPLRVFNNRLNKYNFIKSSFFPELWNFGIVVNGNVSFAKDFKKEPGKISEVHFSIYPRKFDSNDSEIKKYQDPTILSIFQTSQLVFSEEGKLLSPSKYLDACFCRLVKIYFSTPLYLEFVPNLIINEIIFSELDRLASLYSKYCDDKIFSTFYRERVTFDELENIPELKNINNQELQYALIVAKRRNMKCFERVWNYKNDKNSINHFSSSLFNNDKLLCACDRLMSVFPKVLSDTISSIPTNFKCKYVGEYYYSREISKYIHGGEFINFSLAKLSKDSTRLNFILKDINELRFDYYNLSNLPFSSISCGLIIDEILHLKTPLADIIKKHLQLLILKDTEIDDSTIKEFFDKSYILINPI